MFEKKETKASPEISIEELAQAVRENETRVVQQRKAIEDEIADLKKQMQNPATVKTENLSGFNIEEIERNSRPRESRDSIALKINALEIALDQPMCCDKEFLESLRAYLNAIRPEIEKLEAAQYEKINAAKAKKAEFEKFAEDRMTEYAEEDYKIETMLKVAHLSHLDREYNKLVPMNGLWCIKTNVLVTALIDNAINSCNDGQKYAIYGTFPHAVPTMTGSANFGFKGF